MSDQRGYAGPEEALAAIDAKVAAVEPQAARARAWGSEVEALVGMGTAEHGDVRAAVNIQGLLTGLSLTDAVAAQGGRSATRAIQQALREAQEDVRRQAEASSERVWGPESATTTAFRAEVEAATPLIEVQPLDNDGRSRPGHTGQSGQPDRPTAGEGGTW